MDALDRWIPPTHQRAPALQWRSRLLVQLMLVATVTTSLLGLVYLWFGEWPVALQCAALTVAMPAGAVVLRRRGAYGAVVNALLVCTAVVFGIAPLAEARLDGAALVWLGVLPILAAVLLDERWVLLWGPVSALLAAALFLRPSGLWPTQELAAEVTLARVLAFIAFTLTLSMALARAGEGALRDLAFRSSGKSRFLVRVSHELRTPMNGVLALSEALRGRLTDVRERDQLAVLSASAGALAELLDDFLDLARLAGSATQGGPATFEPRKTVASLVALFRPLTQQHGVVLSASVDERVDRAFALEEATLRQVLRTLVGYVLRRVEGGGVALRVELADDSGAGAVDPGRPKDAWRTVPLRFCVTSSVPPSSSSGVLARDAASGRGTPAPLPGQAAASGSSLALCAELVEGLGGRLEASLSKGEAIRIAFTLPLAPLARGAVASPPPAVERAPEPPPTAQAQATTATALPAGSVGPPPAVASAMPAASPALAPGAPAAPPSRPLILVVDDNPTNVLVACALAKHAGCDTVTATNGVEALAAVASRPISLVLMDCHMPVMDGYEATRAIRKLSGDKARTPVIALTAAALPEDLQLCLDAGMDEALTKPARLDQIQRALARWVDRASPVRSDVPRA